MPPHTPSCEIPSAAVTGSVVQLRCRDQQSIPPATYSWYKDNQPIRPPHHPNATYLINSHTGILVCMCSDKEQGWSVSSRSYHVIMWKLHFVLTAGRLSASLSRTLQQALKGSSPHPPTSCLSLLQEFKAVSKEDSGRYSCLATNGVGPSQMCEGKHMTIGACVFPHRYFLPHLSAPEKISNAAGRKISVGLFQASF